MKESSRRWIFASVVAALFLGFFIAQLDNEKLYNSLQSHLNQAGIKLQAKSFRLSPMYMGSIDLTDVEVQTSAFSIHADHLFIDLNLAALLTGKPLPQALYIQAADINVHDTMNEPWLKLIKNEGLQLKRIDISQSEIHFEQQHITLEQVNLDIRDIGKNKNPRAELRAHIGDGRLDAHGYLHLKRGEVTRGFGRIKIYDIPLTFIKHSTALETLHGSITTHIYQGKPWQTFGHLALRSQHQDKLELRGKIIGQQNQLFQIQDMILDIKDSGSIQITGSCDDFDTCNIHSTSKALKLSPITSLLNLKNTQNLAQKNTIQDINIDSIWQNQSLSNQGYFSWRGLDYTTTNKLSKKDNLIHIEAGKVEFSQLRQEKDGSWSLEQASFTPNQATQAALQLKSAHYEAGHWLLPLQFHHSKLWLPISNIILNTQINIPQMDGQGSIDGLFTLKTSTVDTHISFDIDASQSQIKSKLLFKPKGILFTLKGDMSWHQELKPYQANVSINLLDSYTFIDYQQPSLTFQSSYVDFNHLNEQNITLPKPLQYWHGKIMGDIHWDNENLNITDADVDMVDFGINQHHIHGKAALKNGKWKTHHLSWSFQKNDALFSTNQHGQLNISAENLDINALALMLKIPGNPSGKLHIKTLALPFGLLKDVSSFYESKKDSIHFKTLKSTFYEGSLHASNLNISNKDNLFNFTASFQVGGIRLNNWNWLHKQFDTHLEGTVYATLNLSTNFDTLAKLSSWKGDGDVIVYNGTWLLNNKNLKADKLTFNMRKREHFSASFQVKDGQRKGQGNILIDDNLNTSGQLVWQGEKFQLSKTWPHISYQ